MTRKINISSIIFHAEPVGYELLKSYLDAWNQMNPQSKNQWEEQAAEYLLQQLNGNNTITTTAQVEGMNNVLHGVPFPLPTSNKRKNRNRWQHYVTQVSFGLW
jgi:hypothetical protein